MLGIDTNVVVRLLVRDDTQQTALAQALIEAENVLIPTTVVLEATWVLSGPYRYPRQAVAAALVDLFGLPRIFLENPEAVKQALLWFADGMDFPDALHLAQSLEVDGWVTFDRSFAMAAARVSTVPVRLL